MEFGGLRTTAWITDTGEIVREESPLGFISVRETPEQAQALAVSGRMRKDLLESSAVVPQIEVRSPPIPPIDDPRNVRRLRMRVAGADLTSPDLEGVGQHITGDVVEIGEPQKTTASPVSLDLDPYLKPEPFIESDDPEIRAAAEEAVRGLVAPLARAEALTRYVNALLQKKPTVSLPSAREVLRTKIGDCNEHTALFVAMARALGLPARIAVGVAYVRGAFYYHAWPEIYIREAPGAGYWLTADPTFNQFPADATHFRLARGGLDKQAAIIPLVGRMQITIVDVDVEPGSTPILVGGEMAGVAPSVLPVGSAGSGTRRSTPPRWCLPCFLGGHR
jgi:transglutaminase-like putative cysteine protease